jgi:hypothetical protein
MSKPRAVTVPSLDTLVSAPSLAQVVGGAGAWNDSMSNGCGDGVHNLPNGTWRQACVDHDHRYFNGGTPADRLAADKQLRDDMITQGAPKWVANTYYAGVRIGAAGRWGKVPVNPGSH